MTLPYQVGQKWSVGFRRFKLPKKATLLNDDDHILIGTILQAKHGSLSSVIAALGA